MEAYPSRSCFILKIDFASARFRAVIDGINVTISGALTDATPFIALHGLAAKGTELDISSLQVASYGGVVNLLDTLEKMAGDYKLTNIPFPIYQTLVVNGGRKFIKSFESVFINFKDGQISKRKEILLHSAESTALVVGDDTSLCCPVYSDYNSPFERGFKSQWALKCPEEAAFWQDYFGFFFNTANQIEQNLGAAVIALNRYFGLLDLRVSNFSQAWELMGLPERKGAWLGKPNIKTTEELGDRLLITTANMNQLSQNILSNVLLALNHDEIKIWDAFQDLSSFAQHQKECSAILEANGATLGDILASIESFKKVKEDLDIGLNNIDIEKIPEILEILGIMNPDAETDRGIAATEIMGEAQLADEDLTACIVILQAFDLVRQTLESRTNELSSMIQLIPAYQSEDIHWSMIRDKIVDMFVSKFSTVQEKSTFQFYFGYLDALKNQPDDASAQGDMMLF